MVVTLYNDKYVELDYDLAVALASATAGAVGPQFRRSLKWSQVTGSWHGKHWSTVMRPSHRMTQPTALQPLLATPKEMQEHTGIN